MPIENSIINIDPPCLRYFQWDLSRFLSGNKIHLEIGFGNGEYLVNLATTRPEDSFLGIEYNPKYFAKGLRRAQGYGVKNLKLISSEAENAIFSIFPDNLVDNVHINFPDPWPKTRHRGRRLIDAVFVTEISRVLKKNGQIFFASDFHEYFLNVVLVFLNNRYIQIHNGDKPCLGRSFKTKYEKEFEAKGSKIFYTVLKKS